MSDDAARLYQSARTTHLERSQRDGIPLYFRSSSYDWDPVLAVSVGATRVSLLGAARILLSGRFSVVEVNEPLMAGAWPALMFYALVALVTRLLPGVRRVRLVSYAIENGHVDLWVARKCRLPLGVARFVTRVVSRAIVRSHERVAFGSEGARDRYAEILRTPIRRARVFPALEPRCQGERNVQKREQVVFLGSFDERKGLPQLLECWSSVRRMQPTAQLLILGKGKLLAKVQSASSAHQGVSAIIDPSRDAIHRNLAEAKVLVLLSQSFGNWREQLGLPILEGLSHGCLILATTETGLADWLQEHGHTVVPPEASADEIAREIVALLRSERTAADVWEDLPEESGRAAADVWMRAAAAERRDRAARARIILTNNYSMQAALSRERAGEYPGQHLYGFSEQPSGDGRLRWVLPSRSIYDITWLGHSAVWMKARGALVRMVGDPLQQWYALTHARRGDLIFAADQWSSRALLLLRRMRVLRVPVLVLVHHAPGGSLERWLLTGADERVFLGPSARAAFARTGPDQGTGTVLPWGPDLTAEVYKRLPRASRILDFVSAGKTNRDFTVLEAAAAQGHLSGVIFSEDEIVRFVEGVREVERRQASYVEIVKTMRTAGAVVIPLRDTSVMAGLTEVSDAIALGLPVLMSASPASPYDLERDRAGFWLRSNDPDELVAQLALLRGHPEITAANLRATFNLRVFRSEVERIALALLGQRTA